MILQVLADPPQVHDRLDSEVPQLRGVADTGQHKKFRAMDRAGREDHFAGCADIPGAIGGDIHVDIAGPGAHWTVHVVDDGKTHLTCSLYEGWGRRVGIARLANVDWSARKPGDPHPTAPAFIEAARQMGFPVI